VSKAKKNGAVGSGYSASAKPSRKFSSTDGLEVIAKADGFRRAGMVWSTKAKRVLRADLTDEQESLLRQCPGLRVVEVEFSAEESGDDK
jgi:hypothetical protein